MASQAIGPLSFDVVQDEGLKEIARVGLAAYPNPAKNAWTFAPSASIA